MQHWTKPGVLLMPIIMSQDGCTIDGNARRSLTPIYATLGWIRASYRNETWARVLLGYLPSYGKNDKPRGMSQETWQVHKRELLRDSMAAVLRPLRKLEGTGVRMQLPKRDGSLQTLTVVPCIAFGSYDNPETKRVSGVKDKYENMPMFCVMYAPANFDVIVMFIIGSNVKFNFDIYVNIYCHRCLCVCYVINLMTFLDICAINYVIIADARLPLRAAQAQARTILATCSEPITTECPGHMRSATMCSLLLRTPTSPAQQRTAWWRACRCGQKAPLCMACDCAIHTCRCEVTRCMCWMVVSLRGSYCSLGTGCIRRAGGTRCVGDVHILTLVS